VPRRATELADGKTGTSADNRTCDSRSADFSVVFRPGQNAADAFHRWQRVLPQLRHQHVKFLQPSPNPLNRGLLAVHRHEITNPVDGLGIGHFPVRQAHLLTHSRFGEHSERARALSAEQLAFK
jgi:hypothetical protein